MKLIMIDLDVLIDKNELAADTALLLNRIRKKGNLICFISRLPRFHIQKNFYRYYNGFICNNGRLAFTCCEMFVNHPMTETEVSSLRKCAADENTGCAFSDLRSLYYEGTQEGYDAFVNRFGAGYVKHGIPADSKFFGCVFYGTLENMKLPEGMFLSGDESFGYVLTDRDDRVNAAIRSARKLSLKKEDTVYLTADLYDDSLAEWAYSVFRMEQTEDGRYHLPAEELRNHSLI